MSGPTLVFGNPTAQSGKAAEHLARAIEGLVRRGHAARLIPTEPAGRTVGLVREAIAREAPALLVSFGGDGTFNEVATGILESGVRVPLGLLPMGTANDQGLSLGIEPGADAIDANLDVIVAGHVVHLDVGRVAALDEQGVVREERFFYDAVGWGMQAEILAQRNKDRVDVEKIPLLRAFYRDKAVYAGAAIERFIGSFIEPTMFDAVVRCDGREIRYEGLMDLIVNGTAMYAGVWVLDRHSEPDDGLFELVPMQGRLDWASKVVRDLAFLPIHQEDLDKIGVTHSLGTRGARFDITLSRADRPMIPSQLDGEEWIPGNRFRVEVLARALDVLAPAGFVPPWR